jgi:hypothetical protein
VAKWLGLAYAGALALFLLWAADAPEAVLFSLFVLPWIVGPAALAAGGAALSPSRGEARAFLILEALVVGSTILLWFHLIVVAPDAQNGIAMMFFPLLQYAAVALFWLSRSFLRDEQ